MLCRSRPTASHPKFKNAVTVGEGSTLGAKVSLKKCVVGGHCSIGAGSKLNGCVIMDHVNIGDQCVTLLLLWHAVTSPLLLWHAVASSLLTPLHLGVCGLPMLVACSCVLQNVIVCSGATVGAKSQVKDSQIGANCTVPANCTCWRTLRAVPALTNAHRAVGAIHTSWHHTMQPTCARSR